LSRLEDSPDAGARGTLPNALIRTPVGNITRIRDLAQAGVYFDNAYADPTQSFTYDPLYRLIAATGREHDGLAQPTAAGFAPIAHPQDTQAQRNYLQTYTYDPVGTSSA